MYAKNIRRAWSATTKSCALGALKLASEARDVNVPAKRADFVFIKLSENLIDFTNFNESIKGKPVFRYNKDDWLKYSICTRNKLLSTNIFFAPERWHPVTTWFDVSTREMTLRHLLVRCGNSFGNSVYLCLVLCFYVLI